LGIDPEDLGSNPTANPPFAQFFTTLSTRMVFPKRPPSITKADGGIIDTEAIVTFDWTLIPYVPAGLQTHQRRLSGFI